MLTCRIFFSKVKERLFSTSLQYCQTPIMKVLNVAEKNDAAKSIADIMSRGGFNRREGLSKFNKIYEYKYRLFNQECKMVMTSVSGHLLNLEFVGSYKGWQSCDPVALFDAPVNMYCPEDFVNIKKTLEREVHTCSALILWTDGDREGENIAFEIIDVCKNVKPNVKIYRAKFSEITPNSIQNACMNLIPPNENINNAVNVRRELDLRIGAAFTRFQTLRLQRIFPQALQNQLISYGSCQFPTLGFVVERYKEIESFLVEPFWKINVEHILDDETHAVFNWKRGRVYKHSVCFNLYKRLLVNPEAKVIDVESKKKSKWRPLPLDTVEFEKLASRKLKITAKTAMTIAEKLYTKGYISYPRTETNKFPNDLNLRNLVGLQVDDNQWGTFAQGVLQDGPNPRQGTKSDNAHPPIHPIKYINTLQGDDKKVYELVVRHFLACVSKDAEGLQTTVEIIINDQEKFVARGLIIIARNYLLVYPYEKWNTKILPEYRVGQVFNPTKILMVDSETSPPSLLTEADLIALMEKHGIGTDATHADHIETIKSRRYIGLTEDSKFVPGQLGMGLVDGYDLMGFEMSKPYLRSGLEADLKRICEGTKDANVVLAEQVKKYKEVFIAAGEQARKLDESLSKYYGQPQNVPPPRNSSSAAAQNSRHILKCPKCKVGDIVVQQKKDKKFYLGCLSYPQCDAVLWLSDIIEELSADESYCEECQGRPKKLKFKVKNRSLFPHYPDNFVACLGGCDMMLLQYWNLPSLKNIGKVSRTFPTPQQSRTETPRQTNTSSSRQSNTSLSRFNSFPETNSRPSFQGQSFGSNSRSYPSNSNNSSDSDELKCQCNAVAIQLTVKKEGPNKGRKFYKCSNPADSQCNFFKWADELPTNSNNSNTFQSARSASRSDSSSTTVKKKRKCGHCQREGHNRKNCPDLT